MTIDYYLLGGFAVASAFLVLLLLQFLSNEGLTIWHGMALGAGVLFSVSIINNYTALVDWLSLGFAGASLGASLFLLGMGLMVLVMAWNIVATRGKRLVR